MGQDNSIIDPAMINFQPEDYITRENMMVLSYKYMLYTGSEFDSAGDISKFPDAGKISEYAVDAVKYLTNTGVILGDSQVIRPSDTVTHACRGSYSTDENIRHKFSAKYIVYSFPTNLNSHFQFISDCFSSEQNR